MPDSQPAFKPQQNAAPKTKLQWALEIAGRGLPVFPLHWTHPDGSCSCSKESNCKSKGKHPIYDGGYEDATTDEAQIREWWAAKPNANIGIHPGDKFAYIDLDVTKGKNGPHSLASYLGTTVEALPSLTYTVQTPSGGWHLYFAVDRAQSNRAGVLHGVDVRGQGGHVVAEGSTIFRQNEFEEWEEMPYKVINDVPVAPIPVGISGLLREQRERAENASETLFPDETDSHRAKYAVRVALNNYPIAVQDNGGDEQTKNAACLARDHNVSEEMCFKIMTEPGGWNERCQPPWEHDELKIKIANGYKYAKDPMGNKYLPESFLMELPDDDGDSVLPANDNELEALDSVIEEMFQYEMNRDKLAGAIRARQLTEEDGHAENHEGMEYIFGKTYSPGLVSFTAAPGGMGKSSHLLLRSVFAAVGRKVLRAVIDAGGECADRVKAMLQAGEVPEEEPIKTWYWNLEDSFDNTALRIIGICATYGLDFSDVRKNLFLNGSEDQMTVAHPGEKGMTTIYEPVLKKMARVILSEKIQLLIVDPFIKTVEVNNENDNSAMKVAIGAWCLLAAKLKIAVGLAHHAAKWNGKDIEMYKAAALRGAGTLHDSVRLVEVFVPMNDDEKSTSVPKGEFHRYYYVFSKKENFGFNWRERTWFTFKGHEVPAYKGSRKPNEKRSVGVAIVARINSALTDYSDYQIADMLMIIGSMTPPTDPTHPDYADFADGVKEGPATTATQARGNVSRSFSDVLGCLADLEDMGEQKPALARRKVSRAMAMLVEAGLVIQGEVFSPWRKKKGQGPMKDAYTITPQGQIYLEQHRRQEKLAGALNEDEDGIL